MVRDLEQSSARVFTDDTVSTAVLDIVRSASDHVILVSPYNKFWDHLRNELKLAIGRGVQVIALFRDGESGEDMDWLGSVGATVYAVDKLHAKLFLNESALIMTSMNLHESSSKNSKEVALRIEDTATKVKLRDYVLQKLIPLGRQVYPQLSSTRQWRTLGFLSRERTTSTPTPAPSHRRRAQPPPTTAGRSSNTLVNSDGTPKGIKVFGGSGDIKAAVTYGRCIRCEQSIRYKVDRPLCDDCFEVWNHYQDWDYLESVCHRCGSKWDTSYAKPLCYPCYQEVAG